MEKIKYHQNGIGWDYDADGKLTDNWDSSLDYGNEYVKVYFRLIPGPIPASALKPKRRERHGIMKHPQSWNLSVSGKIVIMMWNAARRR